MLTELLKQEAISRNIITAESKQLSESDIFFLVRDMPYKRASSREPQTTINEWKGTCSGKHYLLKALYEEMGYKITLMACSHYIGDEVLSKLPQPLKEQFKGQRIPDIHNYIILHLDSKEMIVDATWPPSLEPMGLEINNNFKLGQNMKISGMPIEHFEVPEGSDPQSHKEELLKSMFKEDELKLRDAFFSLIT